MNPLNAAPAMPAVRTQTSVRWLTTALLLATVGLYLLPTPWFERLNNPNENVRVYMTRAIVEDGTFAIDRIVEEWGYVNDKATFDGKLYAGKAPGSSYLGAPFYALHRAVNRRLDRTPSQFEIIWVCRFGGSLLPVLAFLGAFWHFARRRARDVGDATLVYALLAAGSTMLPYALLFASHSACAALVFAGLILGERHRASPSRWVPGLASGFFLGWAICLEYPAALGVGLVALYTTVRAPAPGRWVVSNVLGALLPIALLAWYHYAAFGGILENPYGHLENPDFRTSHSSGFFGLDGVEGSALVGSFFAPFNGLFWFVPWTILPVALLPLALRHPNLRGPAILTGSVLVAYALFVSMVDNWRGGWTAGPRYIMPVVPFLAWYLLEVLREIPLGRAGSLLRTVAMATGLAGAFLCGLSALYFPHYPEQVFNPVFEIGWQFAAQGYVPRTLLLPLSLSLPTVLSIAVALALVPFVLAAAAAAGPRVDRVLHLATAGLLAAAMLHLQARPSTKDQAQLHRLQVVVMQLWELRPDASRTALHKGGLPAGIAPPVHHSLLQQAGQSAAQDGFDATAVALYRAAAGWPRDPDTLRSMESAATPAWDGSPLNEAVPSVENPLVGDGLEEPTGVEGDPMGTTPRRTRRTRRPRATHHAGDAGMVSDEAPSMAPEAPMEPRLLPGRDGSFVPRLPAIPWRRNAE